MSKVPGYLDDHRHGCNQPVCWHRGKEREQWNDVRKSPWVNSLELLLFARLETRKALIHIATDMATCKPEEEPISVHAEYMAI